MDIKLSEKQSVDLGGFAEDTKAKKGEGEKE